MSPGTGDIVVKFTVKDMNGSADISQTLACLWATCYDRESLARAYKGLTVAGGGADYLQGVHKGMMLPGRLFKMGT